MRTDGYKTFVLYNRPNGLKLYAVDFTTYVLDCVNVFVSEYDMKRWVETTIGLLKPYGISVDFNMDKVSRVKIMEMYNNAKELLIKNGKVYISRI